MQSISSLENVSPNKSCDCLSVLSLTRDSGDEYCNAQIKLLEDYQAILKLESNIAVLDQLQHGLLQLDRTK
jgi:hypothetical protein